MNHLTIFITSFNRPYFLLEAIESILAQNVKSNIYILDNSSDASFLNIIKEKIPSNITLVESNKNRGPSWNFTRAFNMVETKYIMVLHDDDRLLPNMLSTQLDILDKNSDIIALSCNGYFIDHDGHNLGKKIINSFHNCIEKFNNSSAVGEKFFSNSCIPFSSTIYRYHKVKDIASKNQIVHKIYNQVSDVVLFMKLADIGVVALNNFALYECRIHNYQDSYNFDEKFLFNLRRYAKYKAKGDLIQKRNLLNTIKIYYSYNIFIFFLKGITNGKCIKIYKNLDYEFFTFKFVYLLWRIILSKIKILFNK